jgi:hypothetical protein
MASKSKGETLSDLLWEASREFNVPFGLLENILTEERIHLYLVSSSRQNVRRRLREIVQEESKNASS